MSGLVVLERRDGVGELVLNRPERRNAVTGPLVEDMISGLAELTEDDSVRVILVRGAGGIFCSGLDLKEFFGGSAPPWLDTFSERWAELHSRLYECDKPIVGALETCALAAGSALALACDVLIAERSAVLHVLEVEKGLPAPLNIVWLTTKFSTGVALELVLGGRPHDGDDLFRLGIAARVAADGQALEVARAEADRFAGFSPSAMAQTKSVLRKLAPVNFRESIRIAQGKQQR